MKFASGYDIYLIFSLIIPSVLVIVQIGYYTLKSIETFIQLRKGRKKKKRRKKKSSKRKNV